MLTFKSFNLMFKKNVIQPGYRIAAAVSADDTAMRAANGGGGKRLGNECYQVEPDLICS
jgi:hypothetical protein